jgi:sugar O-acyltransferase (sialic acid O-acetyltransferase NeuD family)
MKNNIVLIGGGGHSLVCYDVIRQNQNLNLVGFVDIRSDVVLKKIGCKYLGNDDNLGELIKKRFLFFVSVGQIKSPNKRIEIYNKVKKMGGKFIVLISRFSYVSPYASIDEGSIVMNGSVVNSKTKIGKNCIINTNTVIEHEVIIESNVHIAPNATILGNVKIKEGTFVGAGAVIREGMTIEKNSIIPAGKILMNKNN